MDILRVCINNCEIDITVKLINDLCIIMTFKTIITVELSLTFILLLSLIYCFCIHYLACLLEMVYVVLSLKHVVLMYWEDKTLSFVNQVRGCGQITTLQNKN